MEIPIVFHIVLPDPDIITDEDLESCLNFLNLDFIGNNYDRHRIPEYFADLAGKSNIQFCLASKTSEGKVIVAVRRVISGIPEIGLKKDLYYSNRGGSDAWDTERYLNIWITDMGDLISGLGSGPGQRNNYEDGVVIHYKEFRSFEPCRTLTHEIGHYFGLFHLWNSDGSCNDSDFIDDTPVQSHPYYDCPEGIQISCGTEDMYMNFMDYTAQDCMYFFTKGQTSRMEQILRIYRSKLLENNATCSDKEGRLKFDLLPNPITGRQVVLKLNNNSPVLLSVTVHSIEGKLVFSDIQFVSGEILLKLPFLSPGIYIVNANGIARKLIIL